MKHVLHYRHVHQDTDRHGNVRTYYRQRVGTKKVRLRSQVGTAEFEAELEAARLSVEKKPLPFRPRLGPKTQTLGWLANEYRASIEFKELSPRSKATTVGRLDWALHQRLNAGSCALFRDIPLSSFKPKHLRVLRDRKRNQGKPEAANNILKTMRTIFRWGVENRDLQEDPTAIVRKTRNKTNGFPVWSIDDINGFRAFYPIGTVPRAAFEIALTTGLRRADIARLGPSHVKDGKIKIKASKNGKEITQPIDRALQEALSALPASGLVTYLLTEYGKPFTPAGLGNWFRAKCDRAGIAGKSFHGLRKALATELAENGLTEHELAAVMGWKTPKEASTYTKSANDAKMSVSALAKVRGNRS